MILNFELLLFIAPALILSMIAQYLVRSGYARTRQMPARMSGFAAARRVLDAAGLHQVGIEQVPGQLSDHYDPRAKVLRLSADVYHGRSLAAVGIAAHEAGHALQDAHRYLPLTIRNLAVPAASFGSNAGLLLMMVGLFLAVTQLLIVGIVLYSGVVFFQLVNLPVEFNASSRAREQLVAQGIVAYHELPDVNRILNAAALTYVAVTLQAILTLLYFVLRARR